MTSKEKKDEIVKDTKPIKKSRQELIVDKPFSYEKKITSWNESEIVGEQTLIKHHIVESYKEWWGDSVPTSIISKLDISKIEKEASEYAEGIIVAHTTTQDGDSQVVGVQAWWQEIVLNHLKEKGLIFFAKSLQYWKEKAIAWSVDFANYALLKLQDFMFELYKGANEEEKDIFRAKISEHFPDSGLADKLKK